jgi:ABC-2 type transport system permease protein
MSGPAPRPIGSLNGLGCWTLCRRGLLRFWRWSWSTLGGICVSSVLLLAVFILAAGERGEVVPGLSIGTFVAPGVLFFAIAHTAFEGAAVLILEDKIEGTISEVLMAPLTALEVTAGFVVPPMISALGAGVAVFLVTLPFADYVFSNPGLTLVFAVLDALVFALAGGLVGLWADKWEHYGAAEAFLMLPLGFLSGGFFALDSLPAFARPIIQANPLFHAVNGGRDGLTGFSESAPGLGAAFLLVLAVPFALVLWSLVRSGYKVRP